MLKVSNFGVFQMVDFGLRMLKLQSLSFEGKDSGDLNDLTPQPVCLSTSLLSGPVLPLHVVRCPHEGPLNGAQGLVPGIGMGWRRPGDLVCLVKAVCLWRADELRREAEAESSQDGSGLVVCGGTSMVGWWLGLRG